MNKKARPLYFFVTILQLFFVFSVYAEFKKKDVTIRGHHFWVDLAETPAQWQKGLMNREKLAPHEGMLFWADEDRVQSFWMKNTLVSLDMIFIDKNLKIVSIAEKTEQLSEKSHSSGKPARYVLEILGGLSHRYGFKAGDSVLVK